MKQNNRIRIELLKRLDYKKEVKVDQSWTSKIGNTNYETIKTHLKDYDRWGYINLKKIQNNEKNNVFLVSLTAEGEREKGRILKGFI